MFFGNLFVYYQFQGKDHIDKATRELVLTVLIAVAILGVIFLCTLQKVKQSCSESVRDVELDCDKDSNSIIGAFQNAIKLFFTKEMLLLSTTFMYTGKYQSTTCTVHTNQLSKLLPENLTRPKLKSDEMIALCSGRTITYHQVPYHVLY